MYCEWYCGRASQIGSTIRSIYSCICGCSIETAAAQASVEARVTLAEERQQADVLPCETQQQQHAGGEEEQEQARQILGQEVERIVTAEIKAEM